MTDSEILQGLIEKAVGNGFDFAEWKLDQVQYLTGFGANVYAERTPLLFSHSFMKCLAGEKDNWQTIDCTCGGVGPHMILDWHKSECAKSHCDRGWQYYIQQLAITPESERLEYLRRFLD